MAEIVTGLIGVILFSLMWWMVDLWFGMSDDE